MEQVNELERDDLSRDHSRVAVAAPLKARGHCAPPPPFALWRESTPRGRLALVFGDRGAGRPPCPLSARCLKKGRTPSGLRGAEARDASSSPLDIEASARCGGRQRCLPLVFEEEVPAQALDRSVHAKGTKPHPLPSPDDCNQMQALSRKRRYRRD